MSMFITTLTNLMNSRYVGVYNHTTSTINEYDLCEYVRVFDFKKISPNSLLSIGLR